MWCCITPERHAKTSIIMRALAKGTNGKVCVGRPPDDKIFAVWGHLWLGYDLVKECYQKKPFWFIDNGYWNPANGTKKGYYSITYSGLWPIQLAYPERRTDLQIKPWNYNPDGYILVALPGMGFGGMLGFNMEEWSRNIIKTIKKSRRRFLIREKGCSRSLQEDLKGASVLVTHSSKVSIEAVLSGVPCIVAPTNPAASVCSTDLKDIDNPYMPDREKWLNSLSCQHFTLEEMADGTAGYWMGIIKSQSESYNA